MDKRQRNLFRWHIASHRDSAWKRIVAACEGDEVESDGTIWRYCELSQVETILSVDELSRYLSSEFHTHWEKHSDTGGFVRIDEKPTLPPEDAATESTALPCAGGKCPCCFHAARSRDCWCS